MYVSVASAMFQLKMLGLLFIIEDLVTFRTIELEGIDDVQKGSLYSNGLIYFSELRTGVVFV